LPLPSASVRLAAMARAVLLMTATEQPTDAGQQTSERDAKGSTGGEHDGAPISRACPFPPPFPFLPLRPCALPLSPCCGAVGYGRLVCCWPWMEGGAGPAIHHSTHTTASMEELELDKHSLLRGVGPRQANSKGQAALHTPVRHSDQHLFATSMHTAVTTRLTCVSLYCVPPLPAVCL
jgi:hypothetical protein